MTSEPTRRTGDQWRALADTAERDHGTGLLGPILAQVKREEYLLWADLADHDYQWLFPALFTVDGRLTEAVEVVRRYGWGWEFPTEGHTVYLSKARNGMRRLEADAAKGYVLGTVRQMGYVSTRGGNVQSSGMSILPVPGAHRTIVESCDLERYQDRI